MQRPEALYNGQTCNRKVHS